KKRPDLLLVIGGDGPNRSSLEAQIASFDLQKNVRLIGGQPHDRLPDWYSAADLFCLASASEGCPNVLLEALACGCPVITTNVGGISELVTSPSLGVLVERSSQAFATAVDQSLNHNWD